MTSSPPAQWSDLPDLILDAIACHLSSVIDLLALAGVCRPWRSSLRSSQRSRHYLSVMPPLCFSSYQGSTDRYVEEPPFSVEILDPDQPHTRKNTSFTNPCYRIPVPSKFLDMHFLAFSHHTLIFLQRLDPNSYRWTTQSNNEFRPILVDPFTDAELRLPPLLLPLSPFPPDFQPPGWNPHPDNYMHPYYHAALTAPTSHPDSILLLFSMTGDLLAIRPARSDACWSIHHLCDPSISVAHTLISFNGRLLTVSAKADKILDFTDFNPESSPSTDIIQILDVAGGLREGTAFGACRGHLGPQLVDCGGELMLLLFVHEEEDPEGYMCGVKSMDVYRMDFEGMRWVAADGVGDHALFVDCKGVAAAVACPGPGRWGGRRDAVYLTGVAWNVFPLNTNLLDDDDWNVNDCCLLDCGSTSFQIVPRPCFWIYPSLRF